MRIAILSCFPPYRGGISQFNTSLYEELAKHHDVAAFNFTVQYPDFLFPGKTQYIEEEGYKQPFETVRTLNTINPFSYIRTAKAIRRWKPDLLVMRYWMPFFAPSQGYVARRLKRHCKVISILDNVTPHEKMPFARTLTRYFLSGNHAYITLCNAVRDDLLSFNSKANNIVSPHPIYSNFGEKIERSAASKALGLDPQKKTLLFFGLIREYKGLDILIEAFSKLDESYQLLIAGETYGSFDLYRDLIDKSPNRERIHLFNRFIEDSEVAKYFCASDLCVLPYRSATQSGISSISYHFDLPMVTTAVGGLKEMIGDSGTGIVTEQITPDAIAGCIEKYFSDEAVRTKCIECIGSEKRRLSWPTFCKNLINLYKEL